MNKDLSNSIPPVPQNDTFGFDPLPLASPIYTVHFASLESSHISTQNMYTSPYKMCERGICIHMKSV